MFKYTMAAKRGSVKKARGGSVKKARGGSVKKAKSEGNDISFHRNLSADITINEDEKCVSDTKDGSNDETLNTSNTEEEKCQEEMSKDAVEYVTGYIANKYIKQYPELGSTTDVLCDYTPATWMQYILHSSYDGLTVPSSDFKNLILRCEKLFRKFTKGQIPTGRKIEKQLTNKIFNGVITDEKYKILIHDYIKKRKMIRMNYFMYVLSYKNVIKI